MDNRNDLVESMKEHLGYMVMESKLGLPYPNFLNLRKNKQHFILEWNCLQKGLPLEDII